MSDYVMVPRWKVERAAAIIERDGDEHGIGDNMRQWIATTTAPDAESKPCVCSDEDGATCTAQYKAGCLYGKSSVDAPQGKEVVAYWVPQSRVTSDGSYEDGPGNLVLAADASEWERRVGAPLINAALRSQPQVAESAEKSTFQLGVVKPLEWEETWSGGQEDIPSWRGKNPLGLHVDVCFAGKYSLATHADAPPEELAAAKSEAEARYRERVMQALGTKREAPIEAQLDARELERVARDLFATEHENDGIGSYGPNCIRNEPMLTRSERRAIRAITVALRGNQAPPCRTCCDRAYRDGYDTGWMHAGGKPKGGRLPIEPTVLPPAPGG